MKKGPSLVGLVKLSCEILAALLVLSFRCFGQDFSTNGAVIFSNLHLKNPIAEQYYNAPVSLPDGSLADGQSFTVGLFLVQTQGLDLLASYNFYEGPGAGFFPAHVVETPNHPPGSSATFRARVWETVAGSYDIAVASGRYYGEFLNESGSPLINVPVLGARFGPNSLVPPKLDGMQPLTLIPEPDIVALLALASSVVVIARFSKRLESYTK